MTWHNVGRPIARLNRNGRSSLEAEEYVSHLDSSATYFLNDLISAVDQRCYKG